MSLDALFQAAGALALAGWVLLVAVPGARWSAPLAAGAVLPAVLALLYTALAVWVLPGADGGFDSLDAVARLFADRRALLAGWVHYLAFDLFIGAYEVRDARRLGIPHPLVVPCLMLTFLLGPIGLLAYLGLRAAKGGGITLG